jgi:hypothetical protein
MLSLLVRSLTIQWANLLTSSTDKETWEPTIAHLFNIQTETKTGVHVGEVWAGDIPNHGYAAVLNEHVLLKRPEGICTFILLRGHCRFRMPIPF